MKRRSPLLATAALLVTLGALAVWYQPAQPSPSDPTSPPPTLTIQNPEAVFKKAFWKRPTAADKILHAEYREWSDATGLQRWAWFIEVEPSPALLQHLRADNAFSLTALPSAPTLPQDAPVWFQPPTTEADFLRAPSGHLHLTFCHADQKCYATSSGLGFRSGAPSPAAAPTAPLASTGRLPLTSPPDSRKP